MIYGVNTDGAYWHAIVSGVIGDSGRQLAAPASYGQRAARHHRGAAEASRRLAKPLTGRELEVLRLLAAGKSNQRIAHGLVVEPDTVNKHVTHILGKLRAANRTEAAARARQLGLIPWHRRPARPGSTFG